jgi:hypothetical protein
MLKIETPGNFYEQEQIDEAKEWFGAFIGRKNYGLHEKYGVCLLSALSTAERERDAYRKASVEDYSKRNAAEAERDAALAQVAELEARLRGAGDRAIEYCESNRIVPAMIEHTVATQYRLCVKKNGDKVLQGAFEWECGLEHGYTWRDIPEVKEE